MPLSIRSPESSRPRDDSRWQHLPTTRVALDDEAGGLPEGIVVRTATRSVIAKARFQDYERTLKRRASKDKRS